MRSLSHALCLVRYGGSRTRSMGPLPMISGLPGNALIAKKHHLSRAPVINSEPARQQLFRVFGPLGKRLDNHPADAVGADGGGEVTGAPVLSDGRGADVLQPP